jgi:hypothetical protein
MEGHLMSKPLPCNCDGLLCEGNTFVCETCKQEVPICRGVANAKPDDCDTCWGKKNPPEISLLEACKNALEYCQLSLGDCEPDCECIIHTLEAAIAYHAISKSKCCNRQLFLTEAIEALESNDGIGSWQEAVLTVKGLTRRTA